MIAYVTLGTNDLKKAANFYDPLLMEGMGIGRLMEEPDVFIAWGKDMQSPSIGITNPYDGNPATVGNGVMIALDAENPEKVDALHAKALELGAKDEGAPGPRGEGNFYAAYFRDPDGNKLNAFCMLKSPV